jgi:hypothetical protein
MPPEEVQELEEVRESSESSEDIELEDRQTREDDEDEVEAAPLVNSQAQQLWELLNSPVTAKSTLHTIASNLGLTLQETRTQEGQKAIRDVIKIALGDDLAFLGDKLGPLGDAIESIINDRISKAENTFNEKQKERDAQQFATLADSAMKMLDKETKGEFNSLLPKINKLMEDMPIGRQTPETYLRRLYNVVKNESSSTNSGQQETKLEKARRASNQSAIQGRPNVERVLDGSKKNPSYREAIQAAMAGKTIS